ncbi:MAG: hypothetical protein Tsb002_24410 [Wenzhouxiangellaceae bacterium]
MPSISFTTYLVLAVVTLTALGLLAQCVTNFKSKRAEFLSFPIALFLLLPYPAWIALGIFRDDWPLILMMVLLGVPNFILSMQFFVYEWQRKPAPRLALEDHVALLLTAGGLLTIVWALYTRSAAEAAGLGGVYFTSCLMIYSYLVKVWRVYRGHQNLDGLRWVVLITLSIQYGFMILYGQNSGIWLLKLGYGIAEISVFIAMAYKLANQRSSE